MQHRARVGARQVAPARGAGRHPVVLVAVVEEKSGVGPVGPAPEGEARVATPRAVVRRAVEHRIDVRREGRVPVDGVGGVVDRHVGQPPVSRRAIGLAVRTDPLQVAHQGVAVPPGRADVALHAPPRRVELPRPLLPEVVAVHVLHREPQAPLPRVVRRLDLGQHPPRQGWPPGGRGACGGDPPRRSSRRRRPGRSTWPSGPCGVTARSTTSSSRSRSGGEHAASPGGRVGLPGATRGRRRPARRSHTRATSWR